MMTQKTEKSCVEIRLAEMGDRKDIITLQIEQIEENEDMLYFQDEIFDLVISKKDLQRLVRSYNSIMLEKFGVVDII